MSVVSKRWALENYLNAQICCVFLLSIWRGDIDLEMFILCVLAYRDLLRNGRFRFFLRPNTFFFQQSPSFSRECSWKCSEYWFSTEISRRPTHASVPKILSRSLSPIFVGPLHLCCGCYAAWQGSLDWFEVDLSIYPASLFRVLLVLSNSIISNVLIPPVYIYLCTYVYKYLTFLDIDIHWNALIGFQIYSFWQLDYLLWSAPACWMFVGHLCKKNSDYLGSVYQCCNVRLSVT